jgi:hypothetical protein
MRQPPIFLAMEIRQTNRAVSGATKLLAARLRTVRQ